MLSSYVCAIGLGAYLMQLDDLSYAFASMVLLWVAIAQNNANWLGRKPPKRCLHCIKRIEFVGLQYPSVLEKAWGIHSYLEDNMSYKGSLKTKPKNLVLSFITRASWKDVVNYVSQNKKSAALVSVGGNMRSGSWQLATERGLVPWVWLRRTYLWKAVQQSSITPPDIER